MFKLAVMGSLTIKRLAKKCLILVFVLTALWLICRPTSRSSAAYNVIVNRRQPRAVWDFVADLNHLRIINPFLKEIDIVADGSVYPAWHYSAILTEDLPTLGIVRSHADYTVKPLGEDFVITSSTNTCKILCVHTESTMIFRLANEKSGGTIINESLEIHVPLVMSLLLDLSSIIETRKTQLENIKRHLESS